MAPTFTSFLSFFLLSVFSVEAFDRSKCVPFTCGTIPDIGFPFSNDSNAECGIYITCKNDNIPKIKFDKSGREFVVKSMTISRKSGSLIIQDNNLLQQKKPQICNDPLNFTLPKSISPFLTIKLVSPYYTFYKCKRGDRTVHPEIVKLYNYTQCTDYVLYYTNKSVPAIKHNCSVLEYPISEWLIDPYWAAKGDLLSLLAVGFGLEWNLTRECQECHLNKGGYCSQNEVTKQFVCFGKQGKNWL